MGHSAPTGAPEAGRAAGPPPMPPKEPHRLVTHGDTRVDEWYWLQDRRDPRVLEHLRAENAYTEAALARLEPLRNQLFAEMVGRIQETDVSAPLRRGPWWHYQRTRAGSDYALHCRCPATDGSEPPTLDQVPPDEQVILDENQLVGEGGYLALGTFALSPDHRWLAYGVDRNGAERFALRFRDLGDSAHHPPTSWTESPETVEASYGGAWASDNQTFFYTKVDRAMRPFQVWRHVVGTHLDQDVLVLEESDQRFHLGVHRSRDGALVLIEARSSVTAEVQVIEATAPCEAPKVLQARRQGVEYAVDHHPGVSPGEGWFVILTNEGAEDFKVMVAPEGHPELANWRELIPHRPGVRVEDLDVVDGWVVVSERLDAEPRLRLGPFPFSQAQADSATEGGFLDRSWLVPEAESPSATWAGPNLEFHTPWLRYEQSSLVTPRSTWDLHLEERRAVCRKRQPVLAGFDPSRYRTFRLWAQADDGTPVPISVVHRVELLAEVDAPTGTPPAAPAPCLLYGYGAYEHSIDPVFSSLRLSLLDRGFVFAIAHVRGGGELGRHWYEDGKLAAKPHTFGDFVACARRLIDAGFTTPSRLAARGASAGGLLIGAVANMAPELFGAMVAEVPFVDALTTILDDTLPLSVIEWEEWGNPGSDPQAYATMKAYSPYDNVRRSTSDGSPVRYPDILATAGLEDPRVGFWEPAKWVARLRDANPDNRVLLRTELGAGHGGPSGRYEAWREEAFVLAFVLDALGWSDQEPGWKVMSKGVR